MRRLLLRRLRLPALLQRGHIFAVRENHDLIAFAEFGLFVGM